jgi:hypothetical protein
MNLISLSSSCKSFIFECRAPLHKLTSPSAYPAANENPSLSKHLSDTGFLPSYANVISVINLLPLDLNLQIING